MVDKNTDSTKEQLKRQRYEAKYKKISIRFLHTEWKKITTTAYKSGFKKPTDYIKQRILHTDLILLQKTQHYLSLAGQLKKIGVNLNQIARHFNTEKNIRDSSEDISTLLITTKKIIEIVKKV